MSLLPRRILLAAATTLIAAVARAQAPTITVTAPWARATTPSAMAGGAFLTLLASAPDSLTGASSPVASMVQIHETVEQGGVMKMLPVAALKLNPGIKTELKPGGYHVMLMGLKQPLKQGESFPLTLTFANAPAITVQVMVEAPGAGGPSHHM